MKPYSPSGVLLSAILLLSACIQPVLVDEAELLADVEFLASNHLDGRKTGTEGNRIAREYIVNRFEGLDLLPVKENYYQYFNVTNSRNGEEFDEAVNIAGTVKGTKHPDRYVVVTAHFDHLGVRDSLIYNGADDNASGVGGLLAAARYFSEYPPENSILFIAFDAEEQGLAGAHHFVDEPLIPLDQIVLNVNMDMISTNFENELYAVGTSHYPFMKPIIEESVAGANVNVLFGYDTPEAPQDWTSASDHGPFHEKGIPFVYFGVEDHPHYHQPSDIFENINPEFYVNAVETIITFLQDVDGRLDEVVEAAGLN